MVHVNWCSCIDMQDECIHIDLYTCRVYVTGCAKIDHVSTKNRLFLACLLYHNLITIYTTTTKSSSLLQNLMAFLLQLMEMG